MAEQSIIDKAIGLIPGVGKPKRVRRQVSPQVRLAAIRKSLAALTRDVEKLSRLIGSKQKQPAAKRVTSNSRKSRGGGSGQATRSRSAATDRHR